MAEFWSMGGYALYVWGAYGAVALLLVIELIQLRARRRADLGGAPRTPERKADSH